MPPTTSMEPGCLLLASLDSVSENRAARYGEVVAGPTTPFEVVDLPASIFQEDLESGHGAVLVGMLAGVQPRPFSRGLEHWLRCLPPSVARRSHFGVPRGAGHHPSTADMCRNRHLDRDGERVVAGSPTFHAPRGDRHDCRRFGGAVALLGFMTIGMFVAPFAGICMVRALPIGSEPSVGTGSLDVPPGWYEDPPGRSQWRFWDGRVWTGFIASNDQGGVGSLG